MFVQVIQGKVSDASAFRERMDAWEKEVKPGAIGYLGSTGGVATDGTMIAGARFESAEAAQKNSDRPEQGEWWAETVKLFDGDPTFYNCSDVDEILGGGSDTAGFVQVIQGYANDKEKLRQGAAEMDEQIRSARPDVIGGFVAWGPDDGFSQFMYFTSEAEARKGEQGEQMNDEQMQEYQKLVRDVKYIDLTEPWLTSP